METKTEINNVNNQSILIIEDNTDKIIIEETLNNIINIVSSVEKTNNNNSLNIRHFTQSQSHGLYWDSEIREKIFNLPPCINDTTKYDISSGQNKFDNNENISIKTSGNNNIDCGDILRFYDLDNCKKLTIILIKYKQIGNTKQINEILEFDYNEKLRNILFGNIPKKLLEGYVRYIKSIPPGIVSDVIKKKYKDCKIKMQKEFEMYINISPKVDSNTQRRVQCSIPKINELFERYPEFIISRNNEPIIRGVSITQCIESGPRIRKPTIPSINLIID